MAKIIEDILVIKFSKIIKDTDVTETSIASDEVQLAIEQVAQELVGEAVIVEVVRT